MVGPVQGPGRKRVRPRPALGGCRNIYTRSGWPRSTGAPGKAQSVCRRRGKSPLLLPALDPPPDGEARLLGEASDVARLPVVRLPWGHRSEVARGQVAPPRSTVGALVLSAASDAAWGQPRSDRMLTPGRPAGRGRSARGAARPSPADHRPALPFGTDCSRLSRSDLFSAPHGQTPLSVSRPICYNLIVLIVAVAPAFFSPNPP